MSHDPTSILDAIGRIPQGVSLTLSFHMDSYPTPHVALTRTIDRGDRMERLIAKGNGASENLEAAIAQAINEALCEMADILNEANKRHADRVAQGEIEE